MLWEHNLLRFSCVIFLPIIINEMDLLFPSIKSIHNFLLSLYSLFSILVIFLLRFSHSLYPFLLHSCSFWSLVLSLLISLVKSMISYYLSDRHFWHYKFCFFAVVSLQCPLYSLPIDLVLLQGCKNVLESVKQKRKPGGENRSK